MAGQAGAIEINWKLLGKFSDPPEQIVGTWLVFGCMLIFFALWAYYYKYRERGVIVVYRRYEKALIDYQRLHGLEAPAFRKSADSAFERLMEYHAQFKWDSYAGMTVGMVLVSVTLIAIEGPGLSEVYLTVLGVAVGFMLVAAILLCIADLLHTNTQSPIVPLEKRFALIDSSVQLGTLGTMLTLFAVLLFVALISLRVTIFGCVVYLGLLWFWQSKRRIQIDEFEEAFRLLVPADAHEHTGPITLEAYPEE